jgi:hypothetical protein
MNKVKVIRVNRDSITFSNNIILSSDHEDDCCEHHWLAFEDLTLDEFDGLEFDLSNDNFFKKIVDFGIELVPVKGWPVRIAGHGWNNGYYSTNLWLELSDGRRWDIRECQDIND